MLKGASYRCLPKPMTLRRAPTLNLPNQLTVLRLGMCGLLLISMSFTWPYAATTAFFIFSVASLTDWLDGHIARSRNLVTDLGKLLDPLADKILVVAALVALVWSHVAPMWMVVIIIAREFLITGLRAIAAAKQKILAAERVGKHKTISQIVAILVSLACLSLHEFGLQNTLLARFLAGSQIWFYWFALFITVLSGAIYFWKNAAIVNESMENDSLIADHAASAISIPPAPQAVPPSSTTAAGAPAFKEWEAIVEALGQGAQIVILRKGGIAEGRMGFQARHPKFWLFPTGFHQQWEKTKPELRRYLTPAAEPAKEIALHYFAEVTDSVYLSSWEQVARLDDVHFWGEEILRERFHYQDRPGMEAGLHLLIVRVSRINLPHQLAPSPAYEGCKSWIEVPVDWEHDIAAHVVRTEEFATRRSRILAAVATVSVSTSGPLPHVSSTLAPRTA
jgi:CDP-diacylglycerol--glycerol-3-phosphate 3-phosphatidyltransferase